MIQKKFQCVRGKTRGEKNVVKTDLHAFITKVDLMLIFEIDKTRMDNCFYVFFSYKKRTNLLIV